MENDGMSTRDWVTLLLSCWGAIVSTILAIRTIHTDRARLALDAWLQCSHYKEGSPVWRVRISIVNRGRRQVEVTHVGIFHRNGHSYWVSHPVYEDRDELPHILGEGQSLEFNACSGDPPGEGDEMQVVRLGVRASGREYFVNVRNDRDAVQNIYN